jgi:hypothetical protein
MNPTTEQKSEKAWQAALDYLHSEMPRGWFDSWVKPASLVGCEEDMFKIGCTSAYQRDWLTDRLKSTLQRFLTGVMNRAVKVCFVVLEPTSGPENSRPDYQKEEEANQDEPVELGVLHASVRNILLEPGRVVRLPVYYLRWLPYVDAQIIFLVTALWQEYYLSSNGKSPRGIQKVAVRAEQICQWAGLSRAQFFRLIQAGGAMDWFAKKIETDFAIDRRTGHAKKAANKYILYDTPLTPGDAEDLHEFLLSHGFQNSPADTVRTALTLEPKQILCYPTRKPPQDFHKVTPHHTSVQEVIKSLAGFRWNAELSDLADRLAERLTSQGEFILVSWYFLKHWLPLLGWNTAMLILILRNLCYFNDETGEIRDEVWIEEGYDGIAARLGIENVQLIASWFPAGIERKKRTDPLTHRTEQEYNRRMQVQEYLTRFIRRVDHRTNSIGKYAWKFQVQRTDPLTPEDESIQKAITTLLAKSEDQGVLNELFGWVDERGKDCFETVTNEPTIGLRFSQSINNCSETLMEVLKDCFETLEPVGKDCPETLFKTLKAIKDSKIDPDTSSTQNSLTGLSNQVDAPVVVDTIDPNGNWSLEKLLVRADPKNRQALLTGEDGPIPFISWLIYGASQPRIQNPYSLAIAKLKDHPTIGAGGASQRLAELPPARLAALMEQALGWNSPSQPDWRQLFGEVKGERIRLLGDDLGMPLNDKEEY